MAGTQDETTGATRGWAARHLAALLIGNAALALGPWWVRLADTGPVSSAFWRLTLALPIIFVLARISRQPLTDFPKPIWLTMAGAGLLFGLDLASWHVGIDLTRLSNAALFGNSGSLIIMAWGLFALRNRTQIAGWVAFGLAIAGSAILMGRSLELGAGHLTGDLLSLLAGLFYAGYILLLKNARASLGNWNLLFWSSMASAPVLLTIALLRNEPVWPQVWWPVIGLALSSQVLGQGLLVYSMRHFSSLMIGLALLTQPAMAALFGWLAFNEVLGVWDVAGMALVAVALVFARSTER